MRDSKRRRRPHVATWLALLALGAAVLWWQRPRIEPPLRLHLSVPRVLAHETELRAAAAETGLDVELLAAVMFLESSGRVGARSSQGALGLFQLLPGTAGDMARELEMSAPSEEQLLSDALLNARLGARYLAALVLRFGRAGLEETDVEPALVAYNTGPARLERLVEQSGGWEAWRAERVRAGNSGLLAYAARVLKARDFYREHRLFADSEPVPSDGASSAR
jgi:soluble lytic murein transglycosylase